MASGDTGNVEASGSFSDENSEFCDQRSSQCNSDPDLAKIVSAWPSLPEALQAGILAMVNATAPVKKKSKRRR
jgi:hypothetical protein